MKRDLQPIKLSFRTEDGENSFNLIKRKFLSKNVFCYQYKTPNLALQQDAPIKTSLYMHATLRP